MAHLLIVDDEQSIQASLKEILEYEGHKVALAGTGMDGVLAATKTAFDAIFCDVEMPQMDGLDVLDMLAKRASTPVVMISATERWTLPYKPSKRGVRLHSKAIGPEPCVGHPSGTCLSGETWLRRRRCSRSKCIRRNPMQSLGSRRAFEVLHMVKTVGPTDARVLITGGNGSGKELVARQLHNQSERAAGPFVEVNWCYHPVGVDRERVVWPRKGCVHERRGHEKGQI